MRIDAAGIPWYEDDTHYQAIKRMAADPNVFFDSYDDWLSAAEATESRIKQQGVPVFRVPLTLPEFADWCAENRQPMEASARSGYADREAARLIMTQQSE